MNKDKIQTNEIFDICELEWRNANCQIDPNDDFVNLKTVIKLLKNRDTLINKLKCCGNCKYALTMSQMGLYNTRPCKDCINESLWEMED